MKSLWKLKDHIQALRFESLLTRVRMERALNAAEEMRVRERLANNNFDKTQIERILRRGRIIGKTTRQALIDLGRRVPGSNFPVLPAQDPMILVATESRYQDAHYHRAVMLRPALRAHHLAYGFLRGMPFHAMEKCGYEPVPLERIEAIAKHYGGDEFKQETFRAWCNAIDPTKHPRSANFVSNALKIHARLDHATNADYINRLVGQLDRLDTKATRRAIRYLGVSRDGVTLIGGPFNLKFGVTAND
jgi:hypothetical protein